MVFELKLRPPCPDLQEKLCENESIWPKNLILYHIKIIFQIKTRCGSNRFCDVFFLKLRFLKYLAVIELYAKIHEKTAKIRRHKKGYNFWKNKSFDEKSETIILKSLTTLWQNLKCVSLELTEK